MPFNFVGFRIRKNRPKCGKVGVEGAVRSVEGFQAV